MISLILKSYFTLLLSIGLGSLCAFIIGLYWISKFFSKRKFIQDLPSLSSIKKPLATHKLLESEKNNISAIAGDDVIATQLDLARAYIETGSKLAAKMILEEVIAQGS
ncbi:MAG: hypothetical protein JO149_06345, partial [Gammaproteobacteria bacterium]|nr:hypothetical protein [Gammaproteobacteria bacterium]